LPFEFASVLLLAALMGAILLAKVEPAAPALEKEPGEQGDTRQVRLEREKTKAGV
jgi:hypothetical protein